MAALAGEVGPSEAVVADQPLKIADPAGIDQTHRLMALGTLRPLTRFGLGDRLDHLLDHWPEDLSRHLLEALLDPVEVARQELGDVSLQGLGE